MKKYILLLLCLPFMATAQPPGYYNAAAGLNGQALRAALSSIIRHHTALSYTPGLWNAYHTTDVKPNGKLWDVYADIPGGTPAYEYALTVNQCGSTAPAAEGGCYNREHTWPQSKFNSDTPMQTDLFIVYPTDYYVNFNRGDLQYGKVGTATKTFTNGGKVGNNTYPGSAGSCFEPIDSFKGDLARTYFYVSTCYRNDSGKFNTWEMATLVALKSWSAAMLLEWHHLDPVSQKERDRNNAVYALQGNRNPFIDRPEYADCIWGAGDCILAVAAKPAATAITVYPNPATDLLNITWNASSNIPLQLRVNDMAGRTFISQSTGANDTHMQIPLAGWPQGVYMVQLICDGSVSTARFVVD